MFFRVGFWIAWLMILIPLSVDHHLSFKVGDFTVRGQYFGAALWVFLELFSAIRTQDFTSFHELWNRRENRFFAAMAIPAVWAILTVAPSFTRGCFFLAWSVGTLIFVPWLARRVSARLGDLGRWTFYGYYLIQALIIVTDALICIPTQGKWSIGTVMIYSNNLFHKMSLCRPSAFYQEPGYFAATASLVSLMVYFNFMRSGISDDQKKLLQGIWILLLTAMVLCLSRLGWLLALALVGFAIVDWLRQNRTSKKFFADRKVLIAGGFAFLLLAGMGVKFGPMIRAYLNLAPSEDGSFVARIDSSRRALTEFVDHPITGVGPGNSGIYIVQNTQMSPQEAKELRAAPLALSLYPELLAEWGFFGTLLFGLGLLAFLSSLQRGEKFKVLFILNFVYLMTQTLPRFDLWFILGSILAF